MPKKSRHYSYKFKYKRVFTTIFMIIAVVLSILCIGYYIFTIYASNQKVNAVISSQAAKSMDNTLRLARLSVNNIRFSDQAEEWVNETNINKERYDLIILKKIVDKQITRTLDTEYYLGIWKLDSDSSSMLYKGTTYEKDKFLSDELKISKEEWDNILTILESSGEYVLPFDKTENREFLIKFFYQRYSGGEVVYTVLVPFTTFKDVNNDWLIVNGENIIASNSEDMDKMRKIVGDVSQKDNVSQTIWKSKYIVYINYIEDGGLKYYLVTHRTSAYWFIIVLPIFIFITGIMAILMTRISNKIYQPIGKLIRDLELDIEKDGYVDEFQLFTDSVVELKLINHKMQETMEKVSIQTKEQTYYALMLGMNVEYIPEDIGKYCISIFEFSRDNADDILFVKKNQLKALAQTKNDLLYVNLGQTYVALIIKTDQVEDAEEKVANILEKYLKDIVVTIAISEVKNSFSEMHEAYAQTMYTLESKYLFSDKDILRVDASKNIKIEEYHYAIAIENELIFSVIKGNMHALEVFDNLTRENVKNIAITSKMMGNFILALINTVNRIFAELKISPLQLIGKDISFVEWVQESNNPQIIYTIRNVLEEIIMAIQNNQANNSNELIVKMMDHIHKNYMYDIMLNDIARELGLSPQRCSMLFKQVTDDNFKNYLNSYRIQKAKQMQEEDNTIKTAELAELVGFNSANSFIRTYKKYVGISPQTYQQNLIDDSKK